MSHWSWANVCRGSARLEGEGSVWRDCISFTGLLRSAFLPHPTHLHIVLITICLNRFMITLTLKFNAYTRQLLVRKNLLLHSCSSTTFNWRFWNKSVLMESQNSDFSVQAVENECGAHVCSQVQFWWTCSFCCCTVSPTKKKKEKLLQP